MSNIFLKGKTIDLTIPKESDLEIWFSWFNDHKITNFLEQGRFPNTKKKQIEFLESSELTGRIILMIKNKSEKLLGVISLSSINNIRRTCEVAYVCPEKCEKAPFAPVEALALISEHAIERLGIEQIYAGHAWPGLDKWFLKTEVLGYRIEGFHFNGFRHGTKVSHSIRTCLSSKRFEKLKKIRSGKFFQSNEIFLENYLKHKEKESSAIKMKNFLEQIYAYQNIGIN